MMEEKKSSSFSDLLDPPIDSLVLKPFLFLPFLMMLEEKKSSSFSDLHIPTKKPLISPLFTASHPQSQFHLEPNKNSAENFDGQAVGMGFHVARLR